MSGAADTYDEVLDLVDFAKGNGLVAAIAQDHQTGEILMVANMTAESLRKTLESGEVVYWSRSRQRLWHKGEESGNVQRVREILIDCDGDALVIKIEQVGEAACHTGKRSCFYRRIDSGEATDVGIQIFDPEEVYKR